MQEEPIILESKIKKERVHLSRRDFLASLSALLAGGLLAGCNTLDESKQQLETARWGTPTRSPALASPQPRGASTPEAPPAEGQLGVEEFLALSAVLTGFDDLNANVGRAYLESLQSRPEPALTVADLYQQAGFRSASRPVSIEEVVERGIFDEMEMRTLADTIIEYWYTGVYKNNGQDYVATTVDALAWQALTFTKPPTVCGPYPGFWAERPLAVLMPPVHEASLPDKEESGNNN